MIHAGALLLAGAVAVSAGCASSPPLSCERWGHEARLVPPLVRVRTAALDAVRDPLTWGPALLAGVLLVTDADQGISDWASERRPLFGDSASDTSDVLRDTTLAATLATALAAPSGDDLVEVAWHKAKGIGVELGAGYVSGLATIAAKRAVGRLRPNDEDHESFPSGHTSGAAAGALLTRRNLDAIPMEPRTRAVAKAGVTGVAFLTGWARVEAKAHYPSDVLAGYALGNGVASFVHDAFLGRTGRTTWSLSGGPVHGGVGLALTAEW